MTLYFSCKFKTLTPRKGVPGGELNTSDVETILVSHDFGPELADNMYKLRDAIRRWICIRSSFKNRIRGLTLKSSHGKKTYYAYAVVIATGSYHRKLGSRWRRIRWTAFHTVRRWWSLKDKKIFTRRGDSAVEEGTYLTPGQRNNRPPPWPITCTKKYCKTVRSPTKKKSLLAEFSRGRICWRRFKITVRVKDVNTGQRMMRMVSLSMWVYCRFDHSKT